MNMHRRTALAKMVLTPLGAGFGLLSSQQKPEPTKKQEKPKPNPEKKREIHKPNPLVNTAGGALAGLAMGAAIDTQIAVSRTRAKKNN